MSDSALVRIEGDDANLTAALSRSKSAVMSWARDVSAVFTGVVGANLATGVTNWFKEFVKGANEAARAEKILENTIYAMGDRAITTGKKVKALRDEIARTSTFRMSTGVAQELMLVEHMTESMMKKAAKAAADLAASRGGGLDSASGTIAGVLRSPGSAQSALRTSGIMITDDEQKAIDQLVKKGKDAEAQALVLAHVMHSVGGSAAAELNTVSGRWQSLINRIQEFGQKVVIWLEDKVLKSLEALGRIFGVIGDDVAIGADAFLDGFDAIEKAATKLAHAIYEQLKPAFEWLMNAGVNAITAVQFAMEHWDKTLDIIRATVEVIKNVFIDGFKYIFGEAMPAIAAAGARSTANAVRESMAEDGGWGNFFQQENLKEHIRQNEGNARTQAVREQLIRDGAPDNAATTVMAGIVQATGQMADKEKARAAEIEKVLNQHNRFQLKALQDSSLMRDQLAETRRAQAIAELKLPKFKSSDGTAQAIEKFNEAVGKAAPEFNAAKERNLKIIEMVFGASAADIARGKRPPRPGDQAGPKDGKTPSFEELTALNARIQEAAFAKDDPVVKAVDKNAAVVKGAVEQAAGVFGKGLAALSNQVGKLNLGFK